MIIRNKGPIKINLILFALEKSIPRQVVVVVVLIEVERCIEIGGFGRRSCLFVDDAVLVVVLAAALLMMMMFTLKGYNEGVTKSDPTQKCRSAKGISKRVNIKITKDTDVKFFEGFC
jgi:hypothetical protein